jgi:hypothetical protein
MQSGPTEFDRSLRLEQFMRPTKSGCPGLAAEAQNRQANIRGSQEIDGWPSEEHVNWQQGICARLGGLRSSAICWYETGQMLLASVKIEVHIEVPCMTN